LSRFLKQTKNPFKKYFPHTEQRLIGSWDQECGSGVEETAKFAWFLSKFKRFLAAKKQFRLFYANSTEKSQFHS
jgi:hypothetical protein